MKDSGDRQIEWKIANLPFVECDPTLMRQVVMNLLSNAVKYTRPRDRAVIEVGQMQAGDESVIFVRDNGVGFNMKYADKLFGVFQRLHRAEDFEGTGIGLATAQRIIGKHNGRVWAEAELNQGATFYFTLGSSQTANPTRNSGPLLGEIMPEIEILLIEDSPQDVELALDVLKGENLANQIHVERDGEEALDFLFSVGALRNVRAGSPSWFCWI